MIPKIRKIWLVSFPFSYLSATKLRPALVMANHKEEVIILGIFSIIPDENLRETWVLISENDREFKQTGLKKMSLIRGDKIATLSKFIFQKKLGILSSDLMEKVNLALKKSLNL
ncbi:MAG: type II toxin-antitoxin system PemK/MazF family toxin [Cyanobacteria bacterium]|nr:type II toxin-antitoxin system PemK/MazF family toxin [Cyanobacteria bacterium CG_2015-16_32_12]NCO78961.1 type II toxin-antitoxin system PemK/MazF family toxin [Cyanobacteria bacterium CG_2015-22_32_23]NCQ03088.1 type II toxin-antitoxin system PemK/MazF family toxin [Cyanobacteria bacterium CG_2015-09_32_10]NCQ42228.1 type II toxin-antitoxin system PemK/MazF family toxin [Cyanobacteria bacterium CG_2015-04_32_10]NCS83747.1 type II toxin-antitoxin system PemK/MazF family toxin [Cyanobacteria